jgi:hypothetical protein
MTNSALVYESQCGGVCTDKKENQIFLIYKEIHNGAVAKSYMTNGLLLIYGEIFADFLIQGASGIDARFLKQI